PNERNSNYPLSPPANGNPEPCPYRRNGSAPGFSSSPKIMSPNQPRGWPSACPYSPLPRSLFRSIPLSPNPDFARTAYTAQPNGLLENRKRASAPGAPIALPATPAKEGSLPRQ